MISGFLQLKDVENGALVRFANGDFAVISQYSSNEKPLDRDGFIVGSGEYLHANLTTWVLVLDMDYLWDCVELDDLEYPKPIIKAPENKKTPD